MFRLVVLFAALVAAASSAAVPVPEPEVDLFVPPLDGRIVGGSITDVSKHPYQISMLYKSCDACTFNHRCGGSIITPKIILTAAHCVVGTVASRLHVVAGLNNRNGHGFVAPVEKVIYHEDYYKVIAYENDVAILFLALEIPLNNFDMKAIQLADENPATGLVATVSGWGTTTEGGYASEVLLEVDVKIISTESCEADYGENKLTETMLCAGTPQGGKDACQGDSGGPLVVDGILVGVVSWGYGCARPEYPGVYASVANLRPWIDGKIKANS